MRTLVITVVFAFVATFVRAQPRAESKYTDASGFHFVGSPAEVAEFDRRHEESQRMVAAADRRRVAENDHWKRLASMAKFAQPLITREICGARDEIERLRGLMADERRAAKISGVLDTELMSTLGELIVAQEDLRDNYTALLVNRFGLAPLPCGCVKAFFGCDRQNPGCRAALDEYQEVWLGGRGVLTGYDELVLPTADQPDEINEWPEACERARPKKLKQPKTSASTAR